MCVAGVEVKVGKEVECAVLEVEDDVVRVSLNPAVVEACRKRREGEDGRKEVSEEGRRKSSGDPETDVSRMLPVGFQYETAFLPQLQAGQSLVATVELMAPHYLLVALNTLSGAVLAYAATDSVSEGSTPQPSLSLCPLYLVSLGTAGSSQGLVQSHQNWPEGQHCCTQVLHA